MATVKASPLVTDLRGKLGRAVFVQQPGGVIQLRERVVPYNPRSSAQLVWRDAIRRAGRAYQELTMEEHAAWKEYAESISLHPVRPVNIFVQLSARFLLINSSGEIPRMPPSAPFEGDAIVVQASEEPGGILFSPSSANANDTTTELLVHRLSAPHNRTYLEKYRSQGFAQFGEPALVNLGPGWYACGVRFARPSTGQMDPIIEIERVQVR